MSPGALAFENEQQLTNGALTETKMHYIKQHDAPEGNDHTLVLASFRCLVADLVQQFNGGHPGYAILCATYKLLY